MRKRKKQIIALLCALALFCGNDIMRVRADVSEEVMPEAAEEVMPEATEEVMPESTEEVMPEATEEVTPEATEEVTSETTEEAAPESTEEVTRETAEEAMPETAEEVTRETGETEYEVPENPPAIVESCSISLRDGTKTEISMFALRSISFQNCFGDQLEGLAKEIYDVMVDSYVTQGKTGDIEVAFSTPVTFEAEVSGSSIIENDAYKVVSDEIKAAINGAYQGLMKDYPQVFWIKSLSIGYSVSAESSVESASGWKGTIAGCTLKPEEYAEKYSEKIDEFNGSVAKAKNAVEAKLSDSTSTYDTLRTIHDYLCEELEYNNAALSGDPAYLYAHNVYTAFAGNKKVVCEGYAKAFKILCNEFGIPCILATGEGATSTGTEAHMWNYVKMEDGKWYAVDVTWDDQTIIYYNHFLAGKNTKGFSDSSFSEEHISDSSFAYPELAEGEYVQCDHEWETLEEEIEATCTTAGSRTTKEVCKKCQAVKSGSEKTETIEALGHDYQETIIAATCTEDGSKIKTCTRCDATVTEIISKTGHSYGDWEGVKEATCTQTGERQRACQACGERETDAVPMTAHEYEEEVVTVEPTCTEEGSRTTKEVCKKCQTVKSGSEKTETIEALGHNYQETYITVATCTEEGSETKTCTRCDDTVTEIIPKVPHTYGEWKIVEEATCTQTGERQRACQVCEETETETVPMIAHEYEEKVTKESTCTEEGSKTKTCARCGDTVTETIPKAPHTYGEWILKQVATDTGNGVMERKCAVCGETQTEEIAADGTPVSKELNAYHVIEGADGIWKVGSSVGIRIRVDGEFEKFQSVWIDGVLISSDDYTAEKGSTIINLKTSYLETLSKGSHVITVLYEDGQAGTAFSVTESAVVAGTSPSGNKANNNISRPEGINAQTTAPKTGDTTSLWLYAVILFAGFACIKMFWDKYVDEKYGDEM